MQQQCVGALSENCSSTFSTPQPSSRVCGAAVSTVTASSTNQRVRLSVSASSMRSAAAGRVGQAGHEGRRDKGATWPCARGSSLLAVQCLVRRRLGMARWAFWFGPCLPGRWACLTKFLTSLVTFSSRWPCVPLLQSILTKHRACVPWLDRPFLACADPGHLAYPLPRAAPTQGT